MAWTQEELEQVRAAVLALATGQRTASISYAGPPARTESYVPAQLGELRALLAQMEAALATPARSYRLVTTRKGV